MKRRVRYQSCKEKGFIMLTETGRLLNKFYAFTGNWKGRKGLRMLVLLFLEELSLGLLLLLVRWRGWRLRPTTDSGRRGRVDWTTASLINLGRGGEKELLLYKSPSLFLSSEVNPHGVVHLLQFKEFGSQGFLI